MECICPACQNIYRPVCATDGVQDLNECYLRQQACQGDIKGVTVAKQEPCGMFTIHLLVIWLITYILTSLTVSVLKN